MGIDERIIHYYHLLPSIILCFIYVNYITLIYVIIKLVFIASACYYRAISNQSSAKLLDQLKTVRFSINSMHQDNSIKLFFASLVVQVLPNGKHETEELALRVRKAYANTNKKENEITTFALPKTLISITIMNYKIASKTTQVPTVCTCDTCASCPQFNNFNESRGRGWCNLFDRVAFCHHPLTSDCRLNLAPAIKEKEETIDTVGQQLNKAL